MIKFREKKGKYLPLSLSPFCLLTTPYCLPHILTYLKFCICVAYTSYYHIFSKIKPMNQSFSEQKCLLAVLRPGKISLPLLSRKNDSLT